MEVSWCNGVFPPSNHGSSVRTPARQQRDLAQDIHSHLSLTIQGWMCTWRLLGVITIWRALIKKNSIYADEHKQRHYCFSYHSVPHVCMYCVSLVFSFQTIIDSWSWFHCLFGIWLSGKSSIDYFIKNPWQARLIRCENNARIPDRRCTWQPQMFESLPEVFKLHSEKEYDETHILVIRRRRRQ